MSKSVDKQRGELRKKFLKAHRGHSKVNNPDGWKSGEVHVYWDRRTKALNKLVFFDKKNTGQKR